MRDGGLVGNGIIFGWLVRKSWSDPEWRLALAIVVAMVVMFLVFATAMKMTIASSKKETADALVGFALGREAYT